MSMTAAARGNGMEGATREARILIVDDHPIVREGYTMLISRQPDMEVCGEAEDAPEAVQAVRELSPDLIVIDITLKTGSGIELCKQLAAMRPDMKLLVVSAHEEAFYAERALRAGAKGFVNKEEATGRLIEGIRAVLAGKVFLSQPMTHRVLARTVGGEDVALSAVELLSDRELEVYEYIGRGHTTQQIALKLHLSPKTVESYRENLKKKLNIKNGNELVRSAVQWVLENR